MILAQDLRDSILQAAVQGKLSEQLHSDSPVHDMLQEIRNSKIEMLKAGVVSKDSSCKISEYMVDDIDLVSIPPSWEWVKLGELCTRIGAGSTPAGGSKVYVPTGIKFLREQNIHNDGLCYDGIVYITDKINNSMPGSQVQAKDILLNITGASIGRNSLVPDDFDIANVNQHVLIIRLVDPRLRQYVHWCLCSPLIFNQMMSEQKGDKPGLSATRVSNFLLPIPPIEEQERIVSNLEFLLKKVDAYEDMEQQLIALKANFPADLRGSILQAAMQGKLTEQLESDTPVDILLDEIKPTITVSTGRGRKKSKQLDIEFFDIPQNWKWVKLSECGTTNIGLTYSPSDVTTIGGTVVLRSSNIQNGCMTYDDIVAVNMNVPENKMCHIGDILICARNGSKRLVGKSAIIDKEGMAFGAFMAIYRSKCNPYINYVLDSPHFRKSVLGGAETTTINQVTQDMIENYMVPLPPIEEQQRIVERLDALLPLCDTLVD